MINYLSHVNNPEQLKKISTSELPIVCEEIRIYLLQCISRTGGHLASNLGVVELTVALHYSFDSPIDKFIWDVGHQTYVHKILTERGEKLSTLRKMNGLSGFPKRSESTHDIFETGHTSNSISAAMGIAVARDILKEKYEVIAIIGDGALTGGQAYEGLNNLGASNKNITVVLNDNQMAISENTGGISNYLNKIRNNNKDVNPTTEKIFENLGITYLGPVDGHNINELISILEKSKEINGPKIIHVKTVKGKGYEIAEKSPCEYHGVGSFDIGTGYGNKKSEVSTYSEVFGEKLKNMAAENEKIVAVTAAMPDGTKLNAFAETYKDRFYDVGIAEAHAVTFCAGLATVGFKPFFVVYSTFLQRAYDQIIHDVCMQNLPVVFCIDRAGIVGEDGETHQGVFDIAYLSTIPNLTIMAPKDRAEFEAMLQYAAEAKSPIAIRYPKGSVCEISNNTKAIEHGKWEIVKKGETTILIATGKMVSVAMKVETSTTVVNARFINPIDENMLIEILNYGDKIYVLEDGIEHGGLGTKVIDFYNSRRLLDKVSIQKIAFPISFIEHGKTEELYNKFGLDSDSIMERLINKKIQFGNTKDLAVEVKAIKEQLKNLITYRGV